MTTPRHSFVRHALVYGLGAVSVHLVGLFLLPLYTRHLSTAEYGVLQLLYRIGEVLNICLMVNGIQLATLNFYNQGQGEQGRRHTAATLTLLTLMTFVCGMLLTALLAEPLGRLLGIDNSLLLICGIFTILLQTTIVVPLGLMQARVESRAYVGVTIAICISHVTLAIMAVTVLEWGVWGILLAQAITFGGFGLVLTLRELLRSSFRPKWSELREVLRFALPFAPGGLCFFVLHSGDQFFMARFAGASALGIYALGYRIARGVGVFATEPLCQVWHARMYEAHRRSDASQLFGEVVRRILAVYVFVGLGLVIFAPEVIHALGTATYAQAAIVVGPLVLAYFFSVAADLCDAAFYVTRRTNLKPWIAAVSTACMLLLYASLIPSYGAVGAAVATLIGFVLHAVLTFTVAQRVFRIDLDLRRLAAMLLSAVILAVAGRMLPPQWTFVPAKLALWGLWPLALWATGLVDVREKAYVAGVLQAAMQRVRGGNGLEPAESEIS